MDAEYMRQMQAHVQAVQGAPQMQMAMGMQPQMQGYMQGDPGGGVSHLDMQQLINGGQPGYYFTS